MNNQVKILGLTLVYLFFFSFSSFAQVRPNLAPANPANRVDVNGETELHRAVKSGNKEQVTKLLNSGANLDIQNKTKQTPLHLAVSRGDKEAVKSLIRAGANTQLVDSSKRTAFGEAIASKDKTLVNSFFESGFSVTGDKKYIQDALNTRDDEMVKTLAINGADVSEAIKTVTKEGRYSTFKTLMEGYKGTKMDKTTFKQGLNNFPPHKQKEYTETALQKGMDKNAALDVSLEANAMDATDMILSKGGNVKKAINYGIEKNNFDLIENCLVKHKGDVDIPMKHAVENSNLPLAKLALDHNASPDKYMEVSSEKGNNEIINLLLEKGGNPDLGMMPAIQNNNASTFEILINNGAEVNDARYLVGAVNVNSARMTEALLKKQEEKHGVSRPDPGMLPAIEQGNEIIVNLLIEHGADATHSTYIEKATKMGQYGITEKLLDHDADAQLGLLNAIKGDYIDITELLIERGADASPGRYMIMAAETDNSDMVQLVIERGGDPEDGMETAVSRGKPNALQTLIDFDADPTKQEYVIAAVQNSHDKVLGILIDNEADPHFTEPQTERTLLHIACKNGSKPTAFQLIMADNDPNAVDANGDTPLHFAVTHGKHKADLVELLIEAGADVNAVNEAGVLVFKAAKGSKIKKALKKAGAVKKLD